MEAIRNHAQHRAFPVHSASYGSYWNDERTENIYRAEFFFDETKVRDDKKFKPSTRKEIANEGGKVEIKQCVREYFAELCSIHVESRKLFLAYKVEAESEIAFWRGRWEQESGSRR
jgi:hypothetical protein